MLTNNPCSNCGCKLFDYEIELCTRCKKDAEKAETAAILERLEEYATVEITCTGDFSEHNEFVDWECPLLDGVCCSMCIGFYIKTGRMITEEDLKNG